MHFVLIFLIMWFVHCINLHISNDGISVQSLTFEAKYLGIKASSQWLADNLHSTYHGCLLTHTLVGEVKAHMHTLTQITHTSLGMKGEISLLIDADLAVGICVCRNIVCIKVLRLTECAFIYTCKWCSLGVGRRGSPSMSGHHWIWNAFWQMSSVESCEKWAPPKTQWKEEEKVQQGGELLLLLIAVCLPALGRYLIPFNPLNTTDMNHPFSTLLPLVCLVSHLSLLQSLLKVHQELLLQTSLIVTACTTLFARYLFWRLSEQEMFCHARKLHL